MKNRKSVAEIRQMLREAEFLEQPFLAELMQDERKSVQAALLSWQRNNKKKQSEKEHFQQMFQYESRWRNAGKKWIAGIDEVGRGPLAGPVVAAAVILPEDLPVLPIDDSKKLNRRTKEYLYEILMDNAQVGIGVIAPDTIDAINIYEATKAAMKAALQQLPITPDVLLIDAMKLDVPIEQESIIKGDALSNSIAAASIIAKVYRDRLMAAYALQYPDYGFEKNAGYGTKDHLAALDHFGITPIHRRTFEPIKSLIRQQQ